MPKYRVTASSLWLRSGPGTSFPPLGALYRNDILQSDEIREDWVHVTTSDNKTGWCNRGYIELIEATPIPSTGISYRVDVGTLNIRQGPGLNYSVIGWANDGEMVEGLAISADQQWAQIRKSASVVGWVSLKYVTKLTLPPLDSTDTIMVVTTELLNIRSGPGTEYAIESHVNQGEMVTYLKATPDWKWVNIKTQQGKTGWSTSRYLMERPEGVARKEDYAAKGFHRALSDVLPIRKGPGDEHPPVVDLRFNRVVYVDEISADGKWKHCINSMNKSGWYPVERLSPLGPVALPMNNEEFPWMPIAFQEFGTREIPGPKNNPRVVEYLMSTDLAQKYSNLPDEIDWCAAFVNWCIESAKVPSANSALVHPWTKWGMPAPAPRRGCVMTFLWDDGWAHVTFYLGEIGNYVICLGGNQSDAVWTSVYHKKYISSYRVK